MDQSPHPEAGTLHAMSQGELPANRAVEIEAHVESCPDCAAALMAAGSAADPLVAELRSALQSESATEVSPSDEAPGVVLGGCYKLVERIGQGGMGTVWMARQSAPIRRMVAVKLIKAGMDSTAVLTRFDAERHALALMDHPNIAKVLDAGLLTGRLGKRPYVVMELVKGVSITEYCDARKLTPRERLELFIPVCQAIQHAHQKGIIHRDIKPSNVLVALYDDRPVPKIIDFGVAKAVGQSLTDQTLHTGFNAVVGTPEYMSPEQANLNNLDVDTRSDVYSLGVLLYELLTGSPPHSHESLERAGLLEVLRVVREVEPPRPSHRLSTAAALARIAEARGMDASRLPRIIRGELDWIVMKCLEKDRSRRYETANGLTQDIRRYIAGEPVRAVPPSTAYRVRKFVGKHRGPLIAAAVVFAALTVGVCGLTIGFFRADAARQRAVDAENAAVVQAEVAEHERGKAVAAAAAEVRAKEAVQTSLREVSAAHSDLIWLVVRVAFQLQDGAGDDALKTLVGEMGRIADTLDHAEYGDRRSRNDMRFRTAHALRVLKQYPAAARQLEKALPELDECYGPNSPQAVGALIELALSHRLSGGAALADGYRNRALRSFDALLESPPADRAAQLSLLLYLREWANEPDLAVRLAEKMLADARKQQPVNEVNVVMSVHQLAWAKLQQGSLEEAAKLEQEVLKKYAAFSPDVADPTLLSVAYDAQTLFQRAAQVDAESLAILRRVVGADAVETGVLAARGSQLLRAKDWAGAEEVLRECLTRRVAAAPDAWTTFNTRSMLGESLTGQKKLAEAEPLLLEGFRGMNERRAKIPAGAQVRLVEAANRLVTFYEAAGRPADAKRWQAEIPSRDLTPPIRQLEQ